MNTRRIPVCYIVFLAVLSMAHGRRNFEILFDSCNCTSNPIFAEPSDCHVDKTSVPPKAFVDLHLHKEVPYAKFSFELVALRKNSTYVVFSLKDIDICWFFDTKVKPQVNMIKIMREVLAKFGKLPDKCPVDKDFHFSLKGISFDPEQFPPYVPETRFHSSLNVTTPDDVVFLFESYGEVIHRSKRQWG